MINDDGPIEEVSPAELLSLGPVIYQKIDDPPPSRLPLDSMPPPNFERLVARLMEATDADIVQAFRYGRNGQRQQGIDILAILRSNHRKLVVECKRWRKADVSDVAGWVRRFLRRDDLSEIIEFRLAITFDIESDNRLIEKWYRAIEPIRQHGITPVLWDAGKIEKELAKHPALIEFFFSSTVREQFEKNLAERIDWPSRFRKESVRHGYCMTSVENVSVRADILCPMEHEPRCSAALTFARSDLRNTSLAIRPDMFTLWMQWAATFSSLDDAPFVLYDTRRRRAHLQAGSAMPLLESGEIRQLHWVLSTGWRCFLDAASRIEDRWEALRFPARLGGLDVGYGLCRMTAGFWDAVIVYTSEFDVGVGHSDRHIFRASRTSIVVCLQEARGGFPAGYHVHLCAHVLEARDLYNIEIIWNPPRNNGFAGLPSDAIWNAERSHEWLMGSFLPAVLAWDLERRQESPRFADRFFRRLTPHRNSGASLADVAWSLANAPQSSEVLRLQSAEEALKIAECLEQHFSGYATETLRPVIDMDLNRRVLRLVREFIRSASEDAREHENGHPQTERARMSLSATNHSLA